MSKIPKFKNVHWKLGKTAPQKGHCRIFLSISPQSYNLWCNSRNNISVNFIIKIKNKQGILVDLNHFVVPHFLILCDPYFKNNCSLLSFKYGPSPLTVYETKLKNIYSTSNKRQQKRSHFASLWMLQPIPLVRKKIQTVFV